VRNASPGAFEDAPRPVVAIGNDHLVASELPRHQHRRAQFYYALKGVATIDTAEGAWIAPPERALWIPAGIVHSVRMAGAVSSRSVWIEPDVCRERGSRCQVLKVSPLLHSLLVAASTVPLDVPFPRSPVLARKCLDFLAAPSARDTIEVWRSELGMGRRAFTRAFRRETGLSFTVWRQRACLMAALPRLAAGEPVTAIALDIGYDSPAAFSTMFRRLLGVSPSRYRTTG
jgi:AraC-like DNA-binding protein